mmetsp:Transcript_26326/g.84269  ORF Transcript_26326/g.84269 Transcript_26326/m.84269 type:complete len:174 (+) Transcript_26326:1465-1986(+)
MPGMLAEFKVDLSHQEQDRIISELDGIYHSQPTEWLPVEQIGNMLCHDLGYEDIGEFEDALNGTFLNYITHMPHVEVKVEGDKHYLKLIPEPPETEWKPRKLTYKINSTKDLWKVCMKSAYARAEIPELEFEVAADGKRKIDSIYNHIGSAVWNLGNYVKGNDGMIPEDQKVS